MAIWNTGCVRDRPLVAPGDGSALVCGGDSPLCRPWLQQGPPDDMAQETSSPPPGERKTGIKDYRVLLEALRPTTTGQTLRLVDHILANPQEVLGMSMAELADATGVSISLITKLCKQLGFPGFGALKVSIAQSIGTETVIIHEDLQQGDDYATVIAKVFSANIQALEDTRRMLDPEALGRAVAIILAAERIELYGIGSAAPIAEDAHYRMMRIGLTSRVTNDSHLQVVSAALATPKTAVVTISHSGSTVETLAATAQAKAAGAKVIVITGYSRTPIQKHADVVLQTVARETKFRTEAMTSRIAELSIVDALIAALALARHDPAVAALQTTFDALASKRT
jgi:DNA-binding MurR/RpiR family transcriptional regulator